MVHLIGPIAIGLWLGIVVLIAVLTRQRWPDQQELSRKIIHIGTGAVVPLAWFFAIPAWIAVPFAVLVTLATAINHRLRVVPAVEDIDRNSYGTVAYGLAITMLLILCWPARADAVCAGVLVMALGDGLAGLIGRSVNSARWTVLGQTKSVAGTLTMALVSTLVLVGLMLVNGNAIAWRVAIGISALATALEQVSPAGVDNLSVPLLVGLAWVLLIS